jgi:hypothetical protein
MVKDFILIIPMPAELVDAEKVLRCDLALGLLQQVEERATQRTWTTYLAVLKALKLK